MLSPTTRNRRMKVLKSFSRNINGQIITGDPKHPDEEGRILHVDLETEIVLKRDKLAKPYSHADEAREEVEREERQRARNDAQADGDGDQTGNGEGADDDDNGDDNGGDDGGDQSVAAPLENRATSNEVQTERVSGSGRRKPKAGATGAAKAGTPAGGNQTNATTSHPDTAVDATGSTSGTNAGANATPAAGDEAPTL